MITPIKTMTISQIIARQDDLLMSADDVKTIAKNEKADVINEINNKIEEILKEPQYQHDGEDWRMGLIMAQDVLNDLEEKL